MQREAEDRRLLADNADIDGIDLNDGSVCPDCLMWTQQGLCWCGYLVASHDDQTGHPPTPWGCKCNHHDKGGAK